jgi:N6-adenosine-specific RNA methylase IME4
MTTPPKFAVILSDCAWDYKGQTQHGKDKESTGGAITHYPTMKLEELKALKVSDICEDNAVLFMWTSSPHLPQALEVMKAWGFNYSTIAFVWDKVKINPGYWTMSQCEIVLCGKRGKFPPRGTRNERQFLSECRGAHSAKPEEVRKRIERMFPDCKKVELFARQVVPGWERWGNEVESSITLSA